MTTLAQRYARNEDENNVQDPMFWQHYFHEADFLEKQTIAVADHCAGSDWLSYSIIFTDGSVYGCSCQVNKRGYTTRYASGEIK